jgi:hypothetical protein
VLCAAFAVLSLDPALAAPGPGTSQGTAGPVAQWLAAIIGIGLASLGVIFAPWDDGTAFSDVQSED